MQRAVEVLLGASAGVAVGVVVTGFRLWLTARNRRVPPSTEVRDAERRDATTTRSSPHRTEI